MSIIRLIHIKVDTSETENAVRGMAIDLSGPASGSTSQLVQAMAGFGDGSGAAAGLNAAPLGADMSQQTLLAMPQHT